MHPVHFALYLVAAVCFAAAAPTGKGRGVNLVPLGLLAAVLPLLISAA